MNIGSAHQTFGDVQIILNAYTPSGGMALVFVICGALKTAQMGQMNGTHCVGVKMMSGHVAIKTVHSQ